MRYFKIEGTIEVPKSEYDLDYLTDMLLDNLGEIKASFAGGIKEVYRNGEDLTDTES